MAHAKETRLSQILRDSAALISFQVLIYAAFGGASGGGLVLGVVGAAVMMLVPGRPYGAFLNLIRHLFGLPPGRAKPMSLDV